MAFHEPLTAPCIFTIIPQKKAATLPVSTKGSASSSPTEGERGEDNMLIQGKQRKTEGERRET